MKKSEEVAMAAAARMEKDGLKNAVAFDPATLLVIASIVVEVVRLVRWCRSTPGSALALFKEPGVEGRLALRRAMARVFRAHPEKKSYAADIRSALLALGGEADLATVTSLMKEV